MLKKAAIVYCSPNGSTRHVAQIIGKELEKAGVIILSVDLGKGDNGFSVINEVENGKIALFIGSPVYVNHPVQPIMRFISKLSKNGVCNAVPFVTWGGVSSGIALYDMGKALTEKGFTLVGAGKVMALHSMMWRSENPLGEGHPNEEDDRIIKELVNRVLKKIAAGSPEAIPLSELAYQSKEVHAEMEKMTLEIAKGHMPKREINKDLCTECGVCAEICPVQAIMLSPYPEFGENCICCFQCVQNCPEEAITTDFTLTEERIRGRAKQFNERPFTQIFI